MTEQSELDYVPVYTVCGHLAGEMVRILLESMDIPAIIRQESAGVSMGLTVGSLGLASVCVPEDRADEAMQVLQAMDEGKLEESPEPLDSMAAEENSEEDPQDL